MIGTEQRDLFSLHNGPDVARESDALRDGVDRFAAEVCGFSERRRRQVWVVVWEAIQNAIRYGSKPGDEVQVRLRGEEGSSGLAVELTQPLPWEDWEDYLGPDRKAEVVAGQAQVGGTVSILWFADRIAVEEDGRRISLWFSPEVKGKRQLLPFAPLSSPDEPGAAFVSKGFAGERKAKADARNQTSRGGKENER